MKVLVIDGQGGGLGKALIAAFAKAFPTVPLIALGTNSLATSAMLRAGAAAGATGEHAIAWQARDADLILGAAGILIVGAMMGEISPAMANAVSQSPAVKILIPSQRCGLIIAGTRQLSMEEAVADTISRAAEVLAGRA
jgi:hypothetical protein